MLEKHGNNVWYFYLQIVIWCWNHFKCRCNSFACFLPVIVRSWWTSIAGSRDNFPSKLWVGFSGWPWSSAFNYVSMPSPWHSPWHSGGPQQCCLNEPSHCWYLHHAVVLVWLRGYQGEGHASLAYLNYFLGCPHYIYSKEDVTVAIEEFSGCLVLH